MTEESPSPVIKPDSPKKTDRLDAAILRALADLDVIGDGWNTTPVVTARVNANGIAISETTARKYLTRLCNADKVQALGLHVAPNWSVIDYCSQHKVRFLTFEGCPQCQA